MSTVFHLYEIINLIDAVIFLIIEGGPKGLYDEISQNTPLCFRISINNIVMYPEYANL